MYRTKVTSKGQITLPAPVRQALGIKSGEAVAFLPGENGEFRMRRVGSILDLEGCVPYSGPPVTVEEMKQAIGEHLTAHDEATMSPAVGRRGRRERKQAA